MACEPMEVDEVYRIAYDDTKIFPLGKDMYVGVQWYNNSLSYLIRVSQVFVIISKKKNKIK